ncbi:MAG: GTPase ObgE [Chloroflexota bacterium]|nr:MAG: GTPase ObgE [Chloroflexota bacterium]
MAFDSARVNVKAGDGGPGAVSFRREKFVPEGGPDGGDGGRGGSIYFVAEKGTNTLRTFQRRRHLRADSGERGAIRDRHGKRGEDLRVAVPLGTIVHDDATGDIIADLTEPGAEIMVVRGGRGGLGNSHFATSTNQAPRIAQKGEPGEEKWVRLELKLIADVGIVGFPNAGKSTLLAALTRATPKIGNYPFTTLEPNLGVVDLDDDPFVLADIPGLIEGAHKGIGLGHNFLRHVERTRVLIHLVDGQTEDPLAAFDAINAELALYDPALAEKPQIVGINKIDLTDVRDRMSSIAAAFAARGRETMALSAVTGEGAIDLMRRARTILRDAEKNAPAAATIIVAPVVLRPNAFEPIAVHAEAGGFRLAGRRLERAVAMTDLGNEEAVAFLWRMLDRMGVAQALQRAGAASGATLYIGRDELPWREREARVR